MVCNVQNPSQGFLDPKICSSLKLKMNVFPLGIYFNMQI